MKLSGLILAENEYVKADGEFETMDYCTSETELPFLSFMESEKFLDRMNPNTACVICSQEMVSRLPHSVTGIIISDQPKYTFHRLYESFSKKIKKRSFVSYRGAGCKISEFAFIADKNVAIGNEVTIEPFAVVNENVTIGDKCVIRSNAVIGGASFSFARSNEGEMENLHNNGNVVLEEGVEVMCHTHIAQGIWENDVTRIGRNSKIDAHCHIGHGARTGHSVLIAAGSIIGGNAEIGDNVWIGINATVSNRIQIGKNARVNLGAVVTKNVGDNESVSGNFAVNHRRFIEFVKDDMAGRKNR